MSNASQRDSTSEAGSATTNNDKMGYERGLLCGFMTTRLDLRRARLIQGNWSKVRGVYRVRNRPVVHGMGKKRGRGWRRGGGGEGWDKPNR